MSLREHLSLTTIEDIDEDVTASSILSLHSGSKITEAAHEDEQASESIKEDEEADDMNVSMIEHVYEPTEDGLDLSFMETPRRKEFNLDSTPSDTTTPRSQLTDLDCSELSCVSSPTGEDFVQADEDLDISHNEEFIDIEIPFDEAISMNMSKIESLCQSQNPAMCGFLGEATQLLEQIKIMKDANAADKHEQECRIFGLEMELYETRLQRMEMEANVITYKLQTL